MSNLSQVLSEYSVPLQVWLSPEARVRVAEILIPAMGDKANIVIDPLTQLAQLQGPAVLVITAKELTGTDQELLRILAKKAYPGRSVLVGGTSDRDTLMNAINNWGVVRVVGAPAEEHTLIKAVREAGLYLNREVAMETAIEDLDIETTMLDSAIDQLEHSEERTLQTDRTHVATTFTAGMIQVLENEQQVWSSLITEDPGIENTAIRNALGGMKALSDIVERTLDHTIEQSAGLPPTGEDVDHLMTSICTLVGPDIQHHLGSGVVSAVNPFALSHAILSLCRTETLGGVSRLDTHKTGCTAVVTMNFHASIPDGFIQEWKTNASLSWNILHASGCTIRQTNDHKSIELILPTEDVDHV